ncbi:SH3 domain-containing protein [Clostridium thermobutyricum]|uniref:SH3 domain-containing protein n=1 Tax=Clostridium thermobutyricum TaxID=29372 RepID=UPI0018AA886D|nr:SH3 domain-containing protein [Clostridium thermobutyricum]
MKSKKISALVAGASIMTGALLFSPSMVSHAEVLHHQSNQHKIVSAGPTLKEVNLKTGKVIPTTEQERANAAQSFAVYFHGYSHSTCYNGDNIHQLRNQGSFASSTNETLYNFMLNPNNRWKAEKEAINLHGGSGAADCAFFVSSALRYIGVPIPSSTANCWTLQDNLNNLGWNKHYDLNNLQAGDVCFSGYCGDAHTYVFMGWANSDKSVAWVADSQYGWFGTNMHTRGMNSGLDISPTVFYYTAPGGQINRNVSGNANPDYAPYNVGTVNASVLNVRSGPSTNDSIIGEVYSGQLVQILASDGSWYKINYNGQTGYVYAPYINGSGPVHPDNITITNPTPAPKPQPRPVINPGRQYPSIGVGTIDFKGGPFTYITRNPNWNNDGITSLNNGTRVTITGESGNWYRIDYGQGSAWVPKDRVNTSLNMPVIGIGTINFSGGPFTYSWSRPDWSSPGVNSLYNGTKVEIIGKTNGWYEVNSAQGPVWVPASRINTSLNTPAQQPKPQPKPQPQQKPVTPLNQTGIVSFSGGPFTYVTRNNNWNNDGLGAVYNGTTIHITGESNGWYRFDYNGGSAWVPKDRVNVSNYKSMDVNGIIDFSGGNYTYITRNPNWNNDGICALDNGTSVKVVGEYNGWYHIQYNGGNLAWVPAGRVNTSGYKTMNVNGVISFSGGPFTYVTRRPDWNNDGICGLNNGTPVKVIGSYNGWYRITYNNGSDTAWVLADRVNTSGDTSTSYVATNFMVKPNIAKPNNSKVDNTKVDNTKVDNTKLDNTKVDNTKVDNTKVDNTKVDNAKSVNKTTPSNMQLLKINKEGIINFKGNTGTCTLQGPGWNHKYLFVLKNGTKVQVLQEMKGWYQVKVNNKLVWVPKDRIEIQK